MAIKVEKRVVCDFGERHGGEIRQWRLTVDKESRTFDLCPTCAKPLTRVWDRGRNGTAVPARMQVVTLSEIESQKQKKTPAP